MQVPLIGENSTSFSRLFTSAPPPSPLPLTSSQKLEGWRKRNTEKDQETVQFCTSMPNKVPADS